MKTLLSLLIILYCATPVYADQALVLTELEQIQEKIWYMQRDIAAQKASLDKHKEEFKNLAAGAERKQLGIEERFTTLAELVTSQEEKTYQLEKNLQSLQEAIAALVNEFNQQNATQLQQAEKTGNQEGLLLALREEVALNQQRSENSLTEMQKQLTETRAKLETLLQDDSQSIDQLGIYIGGAALAIAILLSIGFVFLNSKTSRPAAERDKRSKHEL